MAKNTDITRATDSMADDTWMRAATPKSATWISDAEVVETIYAASISTRTPPIARLIMPAPKTHNS